MPKFIIHADQDTTRTQCLGDFCVGHFYIELQGEGLDQGSLAGFQKSEIGSIYVGFNPNNRDMVGDITDDYRHRKIVTMGLPSTVISKEITVNDEQFSSLKLGIENAVNNYGMYNPLISNCIDFVQSMYAAAGQSGSFVENYFTSIELENLGAAGYFAQYIGTRTTIKSLPHTTLNELADLTVEANQYLEDRIFTDSSGTRYHMVQNEIDTLTTPDATSPTGYLTRPLYVGTNASDAFNLIPCNQTPEGGTVVLTLGGDDEVGMNGGYNYLDGGPGSDTATYISSTSPIYAVIGASENTTAVVRRTDNPEENTDTLVDIEKITGTLRDDTKMLI